MVERHLSQKLVDYVMSPGTKNFYHNDGEIDKVMDGTISNTQLYKMAGNSIVVNCLMAIFNKLYVKA